jgi:hypothetical protein
MTFVYGLFIDGWCVMHEKFRPAISDKPIMV